MQLIRCFSLLFLLFIFACNSGNKKKNKQIFKAPFLQQQSTWVDSLMNNMPLEEKLGQLVFLKLEQQDTARISSIQQIQAKIPLGGLFFQAIELNSLFYYTDSLSKPNIPYLHCLDDYQKLETTFPLPRAISLASIKDDSIRNTLINFRAQQLETFNLHINFDWDLAKLHTINQSKDSLFLEQYLQQYAQEANAFQDQSILFGSRNFSNYLFLENDSLQLVDSLMRPFKALAETGFSALLLDDQVYSPNTSLTGGDVYLDTYLKIKMGFGGLVFTDLKDTISVAKALRLNTDCFISKNPQKTYTELANLYTQDILSEEQLNFKVRKILLAKSWAGLDIKPDSTVREKRKQLLAEMEAIPTEVLSRASYEAGITVPFNKDAVLPFKDIHFSSFFVSVLGQDKAKDFLKNFILYQNCQTEYLSDPSKFNPRRMQGFKQILILNQVPLDSTLLKKMESLKKAKGVVLNFGYPENLKFLKEFTVVQVHESNPITYALAAQVLFGGLEAKGQIPYPMADFLPYGLQDTSIQACRFKYTIPEEVGINRKLLERVDSIARYAIWSRATPGCQVLIAKDSKVIYNKTFGHHTYSRRRAVRKTDLYDLASITKVAATSLASMKAYELGNIRLDNSIDKYFDFTNIEGSTIQKITPRNLLSHRSGLRADMPIFTYIKDPDRDFNLYFSKQREYNNTIHVAPGYYLDSVLHDSIFNRVARLELEPNKNYRYSDINFYLLKEIIEKQSGKTLKKFVRQHFYVPLNLKATDFNPLEKHPIGNVVPTENDQRFRKQLVKGYVHDETAALMGGISGNAGLFSNAQDLSILFQMLLNEGTYGNRRFLKPSTVRLFTRHSQGTNRGLGFDMQCPAGTRSCSRSASNSTFGHTGFTGGCVWADADNDLLFIFLCNRINPDRGNTKLYRRSIRRKMHTLVYEALDTYPIKKAVIQ